MSLSVVPFRGGFGVKDDNGQIIVSDNKNKSPFRTAESAKRKIFQEASRWKTYFNYSTIIMKV